MIKLPVPYNRKCGNSEAEIQKHGLMVCASIFKFVVRIEGGAKILHSKRGLVFAKSSQTGMPDSIACKNGILYGIEFKKHGGTISTVQYYKLKEMYQAGARVCICIDPNKIREWVDIGTFTVRIDNWLDVL